MRAFAAAAAVAIASVPAQAEEATVSFHYQATVATQWHHKFTAPYSGKNSLRPDTESATSVVMDLSAVLRPWTGAEITVQPELSGGRGLSSTLGVAAFPSGEVYRVGNPEPSIILGRALLRQALGPWTVTAGKLSTPDLFDNVPLSNDPHTRFMSWGLWASAAYDYPADVRGYTVGVALEWTREWLTARGGMFLEPTEANGDTLETDITKALGFLNTAHMGSYDQAIERHVDVSQTRADGRTKAGFAASANKDFGGGFGAFARVSFNDGQNESWAFTEIDRSAAVGAVQSGALWSRSGDEAGAALVVSGLSGPHRRYLKEGLYGFLIGDGALRYGAEVLGEIFYRAAHAADLPRGQLSASLQPGIQPGPRSGAHLYGTCARGVLTPLALKGAHQGDLVSTSLRPVRSPPASELSPDLLLKMHSLMVKARVLEERLIQMYKQGDGYFWIGGPGEEAFNVPLGLLIHKGQGPQYDYCHFHYRQSGTLVAMGIEPIDAMRQMKNTATDPYSGGRNFVGHFSEFEWNVVPVSSPIEVQYSMAPGTAIANKRAGGRGITIVTGGDAGTAEGDFATCLVWSSRPANPLPVLIVVTNNKWGISTNYQGQHGEKRISDRGKAFGIESKTVDGNDPEVSYRELSAAMEYIRSERKPFLLEAVVSRLYGHSSASGANRINDEADCITGFERRLEERGLLTRQQMDEMRAQLTAELLAAHKQVKEEPQPDPKSIFDHVFAEKDRVRGE